VSAFDCRVCHKPLGRRRQGQGIAVHPGCRRSLDRAELDRAIQEAERALERLQAQSQEGDLAAEFDEATGQARALIRDLRSLKQFVAPPR